MDTLSSASFEKKRILFAHPNKSEYRDIYNHIQELGYNTQHVNSAEDLLHKIQAWPPHLILLAEEMSTISPLDLMSRMNQANKAANSDLQSSDELLLALIIENQEPNYLASLLDGGADEVFCLPIENTILDAKLRLLMRKRELLDQLKRNNIKINELNIRDELTGLYRMGHLQDRLEEEVQRARRTNSPLSCVMIDLDDLKKIIDRFDHKLASKVIADIGQVIKESTRKIDICGHHGGDEFIILLPETSLESAKLVAERLKSAILHRKFKDGKKKITITACFGLAGIDHVFQDDGNSMLRRAERALSDAKRKGAGSILVDQ